jgi:hypothetical protein
MNPKFNIFLKDKFQIIQILKDGIKNVTLLFCQYVDSIAFTGVRDSKIKEYIGYKILNK